MSKIGKLIAQLCPNGVEFKALGEMGTIFGGLTGKSKTDFTDGNARFISYVNVFANPSVNLRADDFVKVAPGERQRGLSRGDILFTGSSETPEDVAMSSVITTDVMEPLYLNSFCIGYRLNDLNTLDPDFAKHLFRSADVRKQLTKTANGVTRFNVSKARLAGVRIPVPPVGIQREIVRVLDFFHTLASELKSGLESELLARNRQYEFYLDQLMNFGGETDVQWIPMGEVGAFIRGRRFVKSDIVGDGIPAIHYGEIYTRYGIAASSVAIHLRPELESSLRYAKPGDVVIVDVGETVEDVGKAVAWLGDEDVAIHDHSFAFRHQQNPSYVSYYLRTKAFQREKAKYVARTKVKTLSMPGIAKIRIPVPPRSVQDRIVATLDTFESLVDDMNIGLPAEVDARRKQYEYYRDRLLTFEDLAA